MLQYRIAHSNSTVNKGEVLAARIAKFFYLDITGEGGDTMAVIHASELLVPSGKETVALFVRSVRHKKYRWRRRIVVEETLLELGSVFVDFYLVCDALGDTQASHERVERVKLLHHEHIIYGDGYTQAAGGNYLIGGIAEVRRHLHPMRRHIPQLRRYASFISLDEEEALSYKEQINLVEPPYRRACHLVQRVGLLHKVQEWVVCNLSLRAVLVDTQQPTADICDVAGNSVYHSQAGTF